MFFHASKGARKQHEMQTAYIKKGVWNFKKIDRKHFKAKIADIDVCVFVCDAWILNYTSHATLNPVPSWAPKKEKKNKFQRRIKFRCDVLLFRMWFFFQIPSYTHVCYAETSKREEAKWKKAREWDNNNDGNRVAVSTIDRNQKISSGQFNSNLNPIKDLVTNPQQHIQQQHQRAHFCAHIWLRQTKNSPAFQHIMFKFFCSSLPLYLTLCFRSVSCYYFVARD